MQNVLNIDKNNALHGQVFNVSIVRIYFVLSAELGGKGDRQETDPLHVYEKWGVFLFSKRR